MKSRSPQSLQIADEVLPVILSRLDSLDIPETINKELESVPGLSEGVALWAAKIVQEAFVLGYYTHQNPDVIIFDKGKT